MHLPVLRQWLLERGADLYHKNAKQETLLLKAIKYSFTPETIDWLLEKGLDISHRNSQGRSVLHLSILTKRYYQPYSLEKRLSIVRKLVEVGAPLNIRDNNGYTALAYAKEYFYPEIGAYLFSQGAGY